MGSGKVADSTGSTAGRMPVISSSSPPTGRTISRSSVDSGSTTHSRPRAWTRVPGLDRVAVLMRVALPKMSGWRRKISCQSALWWKRMTM